MIPIFEIAEAIVQFCSVVFVPTAVFATYVYLRLGRKQTETNRPHWTLRDSRPVFEKVQS